MMVRDKDGKSSVDKRCAIERLPVLLVELQGKTVGIQAAVEKRSNEDIKRKDALLKAIGGALPLAGSN